MMPIIVKQRKKYVDNRRKKVYKRGRIDKKLLQLKTRGEK